MPDFERTVRSLELHLAKSETEAAYIRGKHAGMDFARWQMLRITIGVATLCGFIYLGFIQG